jgi:hypothetical protein
VPYDPEKGKVLCTDGDYDYEELRRPKEKALEAFIKKHDLQHNPYFTSLLVNLDNNTEDEIVIQQMMKCEEIELCRDLVPKVRGDNEHHFFFHTQASMT